MTLTYAIKLELADGRQLEEATCCPEARRRCSFFIFIRTICI